MNFQQLRSVRETARRGFNLTEVAAMLHTGIGGKIIRSPLHQLLLNFRRDLNGEKQSF